MTLVKISRALSREVNKLKFAEPVTHVYNPLAYARAPHEAFLERWGGGKKEVVLVGMNPQSREPLTSERSHAKP